MDVVQGTGDLAGCLKDAFSPSGTGELQLVRSPGHCVPLRRYLSGCLNLTTFPARSSSVATRSWMRLYAVTAYRRSVHLRRPGSDPLLQVLPLVIGLGWCPQSPNLALELLALPNTPVPPGISRKLDWALRQWPAVGSDEWNAGLQAGLESISDGDRRQRVSERLSTLLTGTVDGDEYPLTELERRLAVLTVWVQGRCASDGDGESQWGNVLQQVIAFRQLCIATGSHTLSRPLLGRLLRCATEQVSVEPMWKAEQA